MFGHRTNLSWPWFSDLLDKLWNSFGKPAYVNVMEVLNLIRKVFFTPTYDGKYLRDTVKEKLKNKRLQDTLTNVIIPAYDIKLSYPVIFSTSKVHLKT